MVLDIATVIIATSAITSIINGIFITFYKSKCNKFNCCCLSFNRDTEMEFDIDVEEFHYKNNKPVSVGSLVSYISRSSRNSFDNDQTEVDTNYTEFKKIFKRKSILTKEFIPTLEQIINDVNEKSSNSG